MAKKNLNGRKSGGASSIATIEDSADHDRATEAAVSTTHDVDTSSKPKRKTKDDQPSNGNFGVGEVRKAAAFANSIGGLDKAIALLQILKVAKEIQ